jgi:hypothetical protein
MSNILYTSCGGIYATADDVDTHDRLGGVNESA